MIEEKHVKSTTLITPVKINLALHVTGLNANNYHLLDSLVVFSPSGDKLKISLADEFSFNISGPFASKLSTADNIILKVVQKLSTFLPTNSVYNHNKLSIELEKNIPVAAGLGGGSADAAAIFLAINYIWDLKLPEQTILTLARTLGADIPCCIYYMLHKKSSYISGIGEIISPIEIMPKFYILLINNRSSNPTEKVFAALKQKCNSSINRKYNFANLTELISFLKKTRNDLYDSAISITPGIEEVITTIKGNNSLFTTMSGSGATCIGIYADYSAAKLAETKIRALHPNWYIDIKEIL